MFDGISLVPAVIAAIVNMVVGMLWYGPFFGPQWLKLMKLNPKKMKKPGADTWITAFIGAVVTYIVLGIVVKWAGVATWTGGLGVGVLAWLGFIATTLLGGMLWEKKPFQLYAINVAYHLVTLAIGGAILAVFA